MKHFDIVVTRHNGLLEYLSQEGCTWDEVISHVTDPNVLNGKNVLGVLPVNLAARCETFTELAMNIPAELRGKELTAEQTREYAIGMFTYKVQFQSVVVE